MLRIKVCFLTIAFILVSIFVLLPRGASSNTGVVPLTQTPNQTVNLNPSLSDDGRVVVFESSANFFAGGVAGAFHAIRADVAGEPPVFSDIGSTRIVSPALSSDGSVVAFASTEDLVGENADRNSEIFLFTGSELRQITNTRPASTETRLQDGNFQPSITADGNLVAFTSSGNLFLFDVRTGVFSELTPGHSPKLSGDGSYLYFQREDDLVLLDVMTRVSRVVAADVPELFLTEGRAVSNDGARLVYSAEVATNQSQVFLFDARTNTIRQLTQLGSRSVDVDLQPTISGDGKRVAFATRRRVTNVSDGSVELYLHDIPTGQTLQITNAPANATAGVVSSLNFDGSLVAFSFPRVLSGPVADDLRNNSEIYLASLAPRPFGIASVLNAAAVGREPHQPAAIAPGSIAIIRGDMLAFDTETGIFADPSFALGGTTVKVNGQAARIFYASPQEIVVVVPEGLASGPAEFIATNSEGFSSKAEAVISTAAPGVFTASGDGAGEAIVLDSITQMASPFDPSGGQLRLSIFATGVSRAGSLSVTINNQPLKVETIAASGLRGLDEIQVLVPSELSGAGVSNLVIVADGSQSNPTTVAIRGTPPITDPTPFPTPIPTPVATPSPTSPGIVISQIFGGGGNSNAPYRNDFIEIFNNGHSPVNLNGWSAQYASATASTWSVTPLTNHLLQPGNYYLVQQASGGTNGTPLPQPDATGTIAMAATSGKVALVKATTALSGSCPNDSNIVDLAGYGSTASCFRGGAPAPAPSNTNAIARAANGCTDTRNNNSDFKTGTPNPRNLASPANICAELTAQIILRPQASRLQTRVSARLDTLQLTRLRSRVQAAPLFDILRLFHALSDRRHHVASRTFRLRQLPRRPT